MTVDIEFGNKKKDRSINYLSNLVKIFKFKEDMSINLPYIFDKLHLFQS